MPASMICCVAFRNHSTRQPMPGRFILLSLPSGGFGMKWLVMIAVLCMVAAAQTNSKKRMGKKSPRPAVSCRPGDFMYQSLALSPVSASQAGYHKHTDPVTKKTIELDALLD